MGTGVDFTRIQREQAHTGVPYPVSLVDLRPLFLEVTVGILKSDAKLRKVYMSYHNDGVLDVFIGWCVFLAGLMLFAELLWMVVVYVAIMAPMLWSFKETVTVPRLRREELDLISGRRTANLAPALIAGLLGFTVLGLVLVILLGGTLTARGSDLLSTIAAGIAAVSALAAFLILGYTFRAPRWYVYGALALILAALARSTGLALPWVIMAVGALMAVTGSLYLLRFLRSHPLLPLGQRPQT